MQCAGDEERKRSIYLGTTGHMLHKRQREHLGEVRQMRQSNALYKHKQREYPGGQPEYRSRVVKGRIKYNLDRFIMELEYRRPAKTRILR